MTSPSGASLRAIPFDQAAFRRDLGVQTMAGEAGYDTLERLWYRPTLDVNGMISGFTGEGAKTVIPSFVGAKVSFRLAAKQNPAKCVVENFRGGGKDVPPLTAKGKTCVPTISR